MASWLCPAGRAGSPHAEKVITEEGSLTSHEVFGTAVAPSVLAVFLTSSFCLQLEGLSTIGGMGGPPSRDEEEGPDTRSRRQPTGARTAADGRGSGRKREAGQPQHLPGPALHPLCRAPCSRLPSPFSTGAGPGSPSRTLLGPLHASC